jgi:hypothetical protein
VSKRIKDIERDLEEFKKEVGIDKFNELKKEFNQKSAEMSVIILDAISENSDEKTSYALCLSSLINVICTISLNQADMDFKKFCESIDIVILQLKQAKERENLHEIRRT